MEIEPTTVTFSRQPENNFIVYFSSFSVICEAIVANSSGSKHNGYRFDLVG